MVNKLPKVKMDIESGRISIHFSLYRNINILSDETGAGKTNMVANIINIIRSHGSLEIEGYFNGLKVTYSVVCVLQASQISCDTKDDFRLYIFDDLKESFFDKNISKLYKNSEKSVFLFISRGLVSGYSTRFISDASAVYNLNYAKIDKKEYFSFKSVLDEFTDIPFNKEDVASCQTCICEGEDGKAEFKLYSTLFHNVICSRGRNNVVKKILKVSFSGNVYVIVDMCGFGDCIEELISNLKRKSNSKNKFIIANILSFEFMMLESLFPKKVLLDVKRDFISGKTLEEKLSSELFSEKIGLCSRFSKSSVPQLIIEGCDKCDKYRRPKCNSFSGSRKDIILRMCRNSKEFKYIVLYSSKGGRDFAEDIIGLYEKLL